MKIVITLENVKDGVGCYWGFSVIREGREDAVGSADDLETCIDMVADTILL